MIGPGWMPSRPRPMSRGKRGLFSYRRRSRRGLPLVDLSHKHNYEGPPQPLPPAMLLATAQLPRHRMLTGALHRWLVERWGVPMVAGPAEAREAQALRVDSTKARTRLGWRPHWDLAATLDATKALYAAGDARTAALEQIEATVPS